MPRLIGSPSALLDVGRVYRFLATKNIDAARRAVKAIRENVKIIANIRAQAGQQNTWSRNTGSG